MGWAALLTAGIHVVTPVHIKLGRTGAAWSVWSLIVECYGRIMWLHDHVVYSAVAANDCIVLVYIILSVNVCVVAGALDSKCPHCSFRY